MAAEKARQRGGRKPIQTRRVDVKKGDAQTPDVRCRLVAKDFAAQRDASSFAATPPLEALRLLLSDMSSREGLRDPLLLRDESAVEPAYKLG